MLVAAIQFRKMRTTIHPHNQPAALITGGIYQRTRNPIYIGDLGILTGLCLYLVRLAVATSGSCALVAF